REVGVQRMVRVGGLGDDLLGGELPVAVVDRLQRRTDDRDVHWSTTSNVPNVPVADFGLVGRHSPTPSRPAASTSSRIELRSNLPRIVRSRRTADHGLYCARYRRSATPDALRGVASRIVISP